MRVIVARPHDDEENVTSAKSSVLEEGESQLRMTGNSRKIYGTRDRTPTRNRRRQILIRVSQVALVVTALGVWEWIGQGSKTENLTIGTPWDVAKWIGQWATGKAANGWSDLGVTLEEAGIGWVLGLVVGVVLAAGLASSRWIQRFSMPFVSAFNALPKIALAPLFILIFGENLSSKVYFVTITVFFITFYNVFGGVRSIDPVILRNVKVLGATRWWSIREVYCPAILGWVATSMRLTAAWAITAAVVAEYLGSSKGMGYVVAVGQQSDSTSEVLGGVIIVAVTALIIDRIIVGSERHFSKWRDV